MTIESRTEKKYCISCNNALFRKKKESVRGVNSEEMLYMNTFKRIFGVKEIDAGWLRLIEKYIEEGKTYSGMRDFILFL